MKQRTFKKINIILSVILVILLLSVVYVIAFRGSIPSYSRDELGIYMPYFSADYSDEYNGFTDSHRFYIFNLNKSEIKKVKADIENNSAWFRFTDNTEDILSLYPFVENIPADIDFNNCYVALYSFGDDCFFYDADKYNNRAASTGCAVFDEENGTFYYFEMIW